MSSMQTTTGGLKPRGLSLTAQAAAVLAGAALAAALALFWLHRSQERLAHIDATRSVLQQGERLMALFADAGALACSTNLTPAEWRLLTAQVDGLHAAQGELAFVSIARDGETVFHRQLAAASPPPVPAEPPARAAVSTLNLPVGPGATRPVMVFTREVALPGGARATVELGLDAAAVDASGSAAARSIRALLRLSAIAVAAAFGACLLPVVALVRRDRARQARARREEHLAFSGVLANGIVHDFRNPMSSVRLDAQMLAREAARAGGARPGRTAELAERISRTVERMDRVFQEFLYLGKSRGEALETVDLAACVRDCAETLAPRLEAAGVALDFPAPARPPQVRAAPFALRRALLNVLANAVQFSPRGGTVTVACAAADGEASLTVADRGPGVPPRERERIFDLFVTTRPEGTGLGLFLARTALRACGGEIAALPREGGGAVFRITLPASPEAAP